MDIDGGQADVQQPSFDDGGPAQHDLANMPASGAVKAENGGQHGLKPAQQNLLEQQVAVDESAAAVQGGDSDSKAPEQVAQLGQAQIKPDRSLAQRAIDETMAALNAEPATNAAASVAEHASKPGGASAAQRYTDANGRSLIAEPAAGQQDTVHGSAPAGVSPESVATGGLAESSKEAQAADADTGTQLVNKAQDPTRAPATDEPGVPAGDPAAKRQRLEP